MHRHTPPAKHPLSLQQMYLCEAGPQNSTLHTLSLHLPKNSLPHPRSMESKLRRGWDPILTVTPRHRSQEQPPLICTKLPPYSAPVAIILPSAALSSLSFTPHSYWCHQAQRSGTFPEQFPHPCAHPQSCHLDTTLSNLFCFISLTGSPISATHTHRYNNRKLI